MGACLATPRDDAADAFKAPALDSGSFDAAERHDDPAIAVAMASKLKLRMAAAAKEARSGRFRYNGGVVDSTDAGSVELAISRVTIDDARAATAALDATDPLLVTLFHRRGEVRNADGDGAAAKTNNRASVASRWAVVGVAECFPDGTKNGELVTHFRERARRELSRHKAPVFALPSDLRFCEGTEDRTLRVVVSRRENARRARRDGTEPETDAAGSLRSTTPMNPRSNRAGSPKSSPPTRAFDLGMADDDERRRPSRDARRKKPPSRARALGSATFALAETLRDDRRAGRFDLVTHDTTSTAFEPVQSRSGEICVRVTPASVSRDWMRASGARARAPPGTLSFEAVLAAFEATEQRHAEARAPPETSWATGARAEGAARVPKPSRNARGRTYASSDGRASRTRGAGSRRRGEDPGFDDEDLFSEEVPTAKFAQGGLGGRVEGRVLWD